MAMGGTAKPDPPLEFKTAHHIEQYTVFGSEGHCEATSVGHHVLLTASHCEAPTEDITVDGQDAKIDHIVRDGLDHSLLFLTGITFEDIATVDVGTFGMIGDEIAIVGQPADFLFLFRRGTVAGLEDNGKTKPPLLFYDFNGFFGDSGAAVFNKDHKIIGIISIIRERHQDTYQIKIMGGYPLMFTQAQMDDARKF
jgi:hypothetical protein